MAQAKRKQKFFDVEMPILGKETQLYAFDIKELEGRFIKYDLTRLLRGKSMLLTLKTHIHDGKATSEPVETVVLPYFLRRMVRKGTNYIEDSFSTECNDGRVRVKVFLVTRKKVSRAVRKALREKADEEVKKYIKTKTRNELFDEILKGRLQKKFSLILKKIYPLSLCEIKYFKVEKIFEPEKIEEVKIKKKTVKEEDKKPGEEKE